MQFNPQRYRLRVLSVALAVSLIGIATRATPQNADLTGIRTVEMLIEEPSDEAQRCGITKVGLQTALAGPLLDTKVRVVPSAGDAIAYLNTVTMHLESRDACVTHIQIQLRTYGRAQTRFNAIPTSVIELWTEGHLHFSSPTDHSRRVLETVKEMSHALATQIRLANQTPPSSR
jgi:hypothetical protein